MEAVDELDIAAVVETTHNRYEMHRPGTVHRCYVDSARVGDDGARRHFDDAMGQGDGDLHLRVHASEELTRRIRHVDLDVESAQCRIERACGARYVTLQDASYKLADRNARRLCILYAQREGLRHLHEHSHRISRLDPEQRLGAHLARRSARRDKAPDVDVA